MMEDRRMQQFTCGDYSYESDVKITKSGPDIRLTELEQQLEVAETRCGSLKSQLDYMKMLYQGVHPCSEEESTETVAEAQCPDGQPESMTRSSAREDLVKTIDEDEDNYQENPTTDLEDVKYYKFLQEIQKMQEITREFDDCEHPDSHQYPAKESPKISPRLIEHRCPVLEEEEESISAECRHTKPIRRSHITLGRPTEAITSLRIPEICDEENDEDGTAFQNLRDYSARLQNDMATARNLTSRFNPEMKSECKEYSLVEEGEEGRIRKQELVLKLSESVESAPIVQTVKRKRVVKVNDKRQKTAGLGIKKSMNPKYDDTMSVTSNNKCKRKKGKLRNANSKNTVMSIKEANLTDRRDPKKRKQKAYSSATQMQHRFQPPIQRLPGTKAEVVEIYHNNAVEGGSGSISISSSKHSKHEAIKHLQIDNLVPKKDRLAITDKTVTQNTVDDRTTIAHNNNDNNECNKYDSKSQNNQNYETQDYNGEDRTQGLQFASAHPSRYYDPTITRNYELPTVASKLKKVNRSYFNRFNFRNIPFVVSTSITPSHNLGLNIQQVLSIMKTRQPMSTGMAPLMIRKMSKGIKPVSTLLDRIDPSYSLKSPESMISDRQNKLVSYGRPKTAAECMETLDETHHSKYTSCLSTQVGKLRLNSDEKTSQNPMVDDDEEEETAQQQLENECICCTKKSKSYNKILKQYTSRKSITGNPTLTASALLRERQEEINIGDNQFNRTENVSDGTAKGIREVLINLHDQFEELNIKYEKLQEESAKSKDKSITKEAAALEKELNAKEEEINAVVGLYKEVLQLKQQVRSSVHGRNSFVCIATNEDPLNSVIVPRSGQTQMHRLVTNPMQIFNMRSKAVNSSNTREPATATRLAGLLREIQSFQKQLLAL